LGEKDEEVAMTHKDAYTSKEWQTLIFTPLWVMTAVAGADGKADEKEVAAFAKEVAEAHLYKDSLVKEVMLSLAVDLSNNMTQFQKDSRNIMEGFTDAATVLDTKTNSEHANAFKRAMMGIGVQIAKASGGTLFKPDPISDEEKTALMLIAVTLGVEL
jgi:hypothetical protein